MVSALLLCAWGVDSTLSAAGVVRTAGALSTTVTATAVRIGDHAGYVRAVVDFTVATVGANPEVFAIDAQPLDGNGERSVRLASGRPDDRCAP